MTIEMQTIVETQMIKGANNELKVLSEIVKAAFLHFPFRSQVKGV
jgi:hypothetical protein